MWGSILHFWTVLKSKNALKHLAINEETTSGKCLRSYILDDMFWMYVQKLPELIHPTVNWNFLLEFKKAKIRRAPQCFKELNDHFTRAFQEAF
jgi:hypothetical protein